MKNELYLLSGLSRQHKAALGWFRENHGKVVGWPAPLRGGTLLACRAKGIYKPAWTEYALSLRSSIKSAYADQEPVYDKHAGWTMKYFQEGTNPSSRDDYFTNRALLLCIRDFIPVGVLLQQTVKPAVSYLVLGLATVESWSDGYFLLRSLH